MYIYHLPYLCYRVERALHLMDTDSRALCPVNHFSRDSGSLWQTADYLLLVMYVASL
jgi:hypothetical protein